MAVPKKRSTRARRDRRRAHYSKIKSINLIECPQCHQPKLPHRVCPHCGYYKNREAIEVE
jgi:large subunit ribosomal protein L32